MWKNDDISHFMKYEDILSVLDECNDSCIFIWNITDDHYSISRKAVDKFNLENNSFNQVLKTLEDVVYPDDAALLNEDVERLIRDKEGIHDLEYRWYNKNHQPVWIQCKGRLVNDNENNRLFLIGSISELGKRSKYDNNTSLSRELMLEHEYTQLMNKKDAVKGYFLIIGVDKFKLINERYGTNVGDQVLVDVAQCIVNATGTRKNVYRLKGDEFGILVTGNMTDSDMEAKKLYKEVRCEIDEMIKSRNFNLFYTISGGAFSFDTKKDSFAFMIKNARFALHRAKLTGRNIFVAYNSQDYNDYIKRIELQDKLRDSIVNDFEGFEVYYQPVYKSDKNKVEGAEALIRWNSKDYGFMSPAAFIPLLEESSLIIPLGRWIIKQAAMQCKKWMAINSAFSININLSFVQILKSDVVKDIVNCVNETGIDHQHIIFEATESGNLDSNIMVKNVLSEISGQGFDLAVDDFGTGYSNLRYIRDLMFKIIKVDRAFIQNIDSNKDNYTMVKFIINMAHDLNLKVCVEGVETKEELDCVLQLGADSIQGYYYGKPMPAGEFEKKYL